MLVDVRYRSDADIAATAATTAREVPGVTGATAVVRRRGAAFPAAALPECSASAAEPARRKEGRARPARLPMAQIDGGPFVMPVNAPPTLGDALVAAAQAAGDRGTTYVLSGGGQDFQSYRDLLADASRALPGLRAQGLVPGDSVLLHCDDNRNFVTGFWACLLGGFVPTPVATAPSYRWENATTRRLRAAWDLLDQPPILTDASLRPRVIELRSLWGTEGPRVIALEELRAREPATDLYQARPDDPAVHLLTSGSTGIPKCVRHTHRSVITRAYVNAEANGFGAADVTLNFMPLDHVAGMVMHNLRDVILGCEHVNARTDSFLADPLRWFDWIERYRVTNTSAPNFVITLVNTLADEIARRDWDLSTLRDITNGGEAVISSTTHSFLRLLAPHGMAPDVMRPAWGMSEMCGGVLHSTLRGDDETAGVITVRDLRMDEAVEILPAPAPGHPTFTEVGTPVKGTSVRIVGPDGQLLPEDHIGRFQIRGVTRMAGYYKNPEANASSFTEDGWFDTGDLAFVHAGRLVMTGREKDQIVIRSANYSCHEIESAVGRIDGVLPTFVGACGDHDPGTGTDELVVFCVLTPQDPDTRRRVVDAVSACLVREIGFAPRHVVPVPKEDFPKTSAGKIERAQLLAAYRAGSFDAQLAEVAGVARDTLDDGAPSIGQFRVAWLPDPGAPGVLPGGSWLVLDRAGGELADRLRAGRESGAGATIVVTPGTGYVRRAGLDYEVAPSSAADYAAVVAAVTREYGPVGAIVHAWAADRVAESELVPDGGFELAPLSVHRVLAAGTDTDARVLVVTAGACAVSDSDRIEPLQATITGLVRTANAERGQRLATQLDLSPGDADAASAVLAELADRGGAEVVARRAGKRLVPHLSPLPPAPGAQAGDQAPSRAIRPGGLYLVTGGLGGIGFRLAEFLLAEYAVSLVLTGRSVPAGEQAERLARLRELGDVTYHQADVADVAALRHAVLTAEGRGGRLIDGVLHLAGGAISDYWDDLQSHLLTRESHAEFRRLYHAKLLGTQAVAALLRDRPGALLVLFSSVNGYFGGAAFGAYSSASAFLPAFAEYWHRLGRPVQCQSWSLWSAPDAAGPGDMVIEGRGFARIDPAHGPRLFAGALAQPVTHILIGVDDRNEHMAREIDPASLGPLDVSVSFQGPAAAREQVRAVVAAALSGARVSVRAEPAAPSAVQTERDGRAPEVPSAVEAAVREVWQQTFKDRAIQRDEHFVELGGNSLTAMRLVDKIGTALGVRLAVYQLYEHPTVAELSVEIARITALPPAGPADESFDVA